MKKILSAIIIAYLLIVAIFYFMQRSLIYFPSDNTLRPEQAGIPEMKQVNLQTEDGLDLKAWYVPAKTPNAPTVVYFHGNAGAISDRGIMIHSYVHHGYGVLLTSYRGYSDNPGSPTEHGLYRDGRAAIKFLMQNRIDTKCTVLYGESLGSAVAVQLATEQPFGAVVLQSPFTSLTDVGRYHYPWLPVKWLLKDRFNIMENIKQIHTPLLIIHGEKDDVIPVKLARRLFEAADQPKELLLLKDVGHNDLYPADYILLFIQKTVRCG